MADSIVVKHSLYILVSLFLAFHADAQIYSSRFSSHDIYKYDEVTGVRIGEGAFIPAQSGLVNPHGIIDRGTDIIVASWTHEIKRYDRDTGAFLGNFIESDAGLGNPVYLEVGPDGYLYVSSQLNDRIFRFNFLGETGVSIDSGPWISGGTMDGPSGFDWSPDGALFYVAGRHSANVVAYHATTGEWVGAFSTSNNSGSTFGLAVDDRSGDIFVAVDGSVVRYDLSAGFPLNGITPPSTTISTSGAIGLEPSTDGSFILVASGNNLFVISIADNSLSGPIFTSNDGNLHNFFHYSEVEEEVETINEPHAFVVGFNNNSDENLVEVIAEYLFFKSSDGVELVFQYSSDLENWSDAAVYQLSGVTVIRNNSIDSVQVSEPSDADSSWLITERKIVSGNPPTFIRIRQRSITNGS